MSKVEMMSAKGKKKGALVPRLRFPEFRDAGEWGLRYGDNLFENIINKNHNSDLPILAITQEHGAIPRSAIDYNVSVTEKSVESYKVVAVGDFIISLRSFQGGIEYSRYCGLCSPAYIVLRKRMMLNEAFFKFYLKSDQLICRLNVNIEGLRDGKMISYKQFSEIPLPFPLLDEQKKIADCLSSLDERIAAEANKLDALKSHKNGLLKQLFPTDGETLPALRFPEFRDAGEWEISPLGQISENLDNRRVPITENVRVRGDIPYYGASGIVDYVNDFIFDEELLCVSEDGANLIARTSPIAFSILGKSWVNNHAHVLKFHLASRRKLVENYINFIKIDEFLTGMAQPKLNKAKLEVIPIPIPPTEEEEQKVADGLSSLDELITAQTQKIDLLKTHKKGLMQQLFPVVDEAKA